MSKNYIALFFIVTLIGLDPTCLAEPNNSLTGTIYFDTNKPTLRVEIAANQKQREVGLMFRTNLAADQGMLFVFEEKSILNIWMKNTLIPLDVIFIDSTGKIISTLKNLPPCKQLNCPIYHSDAPASFMLEVNTGFIDQNQIKPGQILKLPF